MARRRAVVVIHAFGLSGTPSRGHVATAAANRVLHRVLGQLEVAHVADERGQYRRALVAECPLDRAGGAGRVAPVVPAHPQSGRTSTDP